jgi:hypothetical protein
MQSMSNTVAICPANRLLPYMMHQLLTTQQPSAITRSRERFGMIRMGRSSKLYIVGKDVEELLWMRLLSSQYYCSVGLRNGQ